MLGTSLFVTLSCLMLVEWGSCLDNGLALTPPMGWMTWEQFRCNVDCEKDPRNCISEDLIVSQAFLLKNLGLLDAGYEYVVIDDCWLNKTRDSAGNLIPDPVRFPNGMKYIGDILHKFGFKFGLYEDYGTKTCGGYPGTDVAHMQRDIASFVSWGVDYIKLDGCYSSTTTQPTGYAKYERLLNATKRPVVFSCSWPAYRGVAKINSTDRDLLINHCNSWRLYSDIDDSWKSVLSIIEFYATNSNNFSTWAGPGHWNDPDMLIIGDAGLSPDQQRVQIAMWAVMAAPLLLSVDLRSIPAASLALLKNPHILTIDQDPLGKQGLLVTKIGTVQVWRRQLSGGRFAVAVLQPAANASTVNINLTQAGVPNRGGPTQTYTIADAFTEVLNMTVHASTPIRVDLAPTSVQMMMVWT